jgi:hypothetical protein
MLSINADGFMLPKVFFNGVRRLLSAFGPNKIFGFYVQFFAKNS